MEEDESLGTHPALTTDAVLSSIFSELGSARDLAASSRTCRQWARACNFDAVWETLYLREYGMPDAHERRASYRQQYQRAKALSSWTYPEITPFLGPRWSSDNFIIGASFDPVTGCLATASLILNKLSVRVSVIELPGLPVPQALAWDPALMCLGMDYPLHQGEALMSADKHGFFPLGCHSGRCVFPSTGALLVHSLQSPGPLLGRLELGTARVAAALAVDEWMCVSIAPSGHVRFWSLDHMACFGEQTLRSANHADALNWDNCLALAPGPPSISSSDSGSVGSSLVAIINFDRQLGPSVLVFKAERLTQSGGGSGRVSTLQVLSMDHPTSCCFSRRRLVVGSSVSRSVQGVVSFTATATVYCTTTWQKLGTLVSAEQRTTCPPVRLSCTPRVHALEGVVVFEMPRAQDERPPTVYGQAVHAMNLLHLDAGSVRATLILGDEHRNSTLTVGVAKDCWMNVSMFLSTPKRLLMLSRNQLLELPLV